MLPLGNGHAMSATLSFFTAHSTQQQQHTWQLYDGATTIQVGSIQPHDMDVNDEAAIILDGDEALWENTQESFKK